MLNTTKSVFQVKISGGLTIPLGNFQGQTNGEVGPAFLDLEAGQPDAEGFVKVNITGASDFIFVDATALANFVICIKPLVPIPAAGLLGCAGGMDVGITLDQDHHLGELGVDGFTATQCAEQRGQIEIPYAACSAGKLGVACEANADCDSTAGADDGVCNHVSARCTGGDLGAVCQADAQCDTAEDIGHCGMAHHGVCNGPLVPGLGTGDTGPGELFIVPNPDPAMQTNGLPIELGFESALPCGDESRGNRIGFALTTGKSVSRVMNANNELGRTLNFEAQGENFSCTDWQSNTRGRLVLSAPALDQSLVGDVATIFVFASH